MSDAQDADKAGQDTPASDESQRDQPQTITDAERAANPIGSAQREREQQRHDHRGDGGKFAKADDDKGKSMPDAQQQKPDGKDAKGDKPDAEGQKDQSQERRPGHVPQQALEAERRKRQERDGENETLKRELAEHRRELAEMRGMFKAGQQPGSQPKQEQPKPPEFWDDPNAAVEFRMRGALDPVQQQLEQRFQQQEQRALAERTYYSRSFAEQVHGKESVNSALAALSSHLQANHGDRERVEAQLSQSMDPVGDVVRWHKQQTTMREIGDDPNAYRERLKAEILAEMQQQNGGERHDPPPAAQRQPPEQQQLPSSFAAQRGGGPRGGPAYGGPRSLSEIMPRG